MTKETDKQQPSGPQPPGQQPEAGTADESQPDQAEGPKPENPPPPVSDVKVTAAEVMEAEDKELEVKKTAAKEDVSASDASPAGGPTSGQNGPRNAPPKRPRPARKNPPPQPPPAPRQGALWLVILVLALAVIGLAGYGQTRLNELAAGPDESVLQKLAGEVDNLVATTEELARDVAAANELAGQTSPETATALSGLQSRLGGLDAKLTDIGAGREHWLLREAHYLTTLAYQRLQVENNVTGAAILLQAADQRVALVKAPVALSLRKALADDLIALRQVAPVDQVGIYHRLSALATAIGQLSQSLVLEPEEAMGTVVPLSGSGAGASNESGWQDFLRPLLNAFRDLVVVRRLDAPLEPLMAPHQSIFLQQNLLLMLEQAQTALVRGQTPVYQDSLRRVGAWITAYYDVEKPQVAAILDELHQLEAIEIAPSVPAISAAYQQFNQWEQERRAGAPLADNSLEVVSPTGAESSVQPEPAEPEPVEPEPVEPEPVEPEPVEPEPVEPEPVESGPPMSIDESGVEL